MHACAIPGSDAPQLPSNKQVFQEVVSYVKGSAEAISSESGLLTLSQYLEVQCPETLASTLQCTPTDFLQHS
jgi:hypothetical protein